MMMSIPSFPLLHQVNVRRGALAVCAVLAMTSAQASDVVAFTDAQHSMINASGVRVVRLDAPFVLETSLGAQLPTESAKAEAIVRQRLAQGGSGLQTQLANAWQGVADAWGLGISRIPAVVVDHRYVVYGDPDVARAVAHIDAWRSSRP